MDTMPPDSAIAASGLQIFIRRIALHSHLTRPSKNDDQVIG